MKSASDYGVRTIREQTMFSKILVCLDGSKETEQIIPYAVAQAQCFNGSITLINVINVPSVAVPASLKAIPRKHEVKEIGDEKGITESEKQAADYLGKLSRLLEKGGINVDCVIIRGTPAESIAAYSDQHDMDLIILTTRERSSLGRTVFGSVTDFVARNTKAPVLIIKPKNE